MGPGIKMTKNPGLFHPHIFSPYGDLEVWRKRFGQWADILKVTHEKGSDRHLQTMFRLLGRTLYDRDLPEAQKAIIDEEQDKGQIDYLQMDTPIEDALQIFKLVAVDPPITTVKSLISSYQKVTGCRREKNEKLSNFVSCFRGLPAKHLLHSHASSSSQIG